VTLLICDVDRFKDCNVYGHEVGDIVLVEIARTLTQCRRCGGDLAIRCRYGTTVRLSRIASR
jgi:diguanylate cyclase (GGDEF)-like protein